MSAADGPEQRTADLTERFDADFDELLTDDDEPTMVWGCDICDKVRPIVWHGFVCGIETSACAECAS